ncbi:hypothetical protein [Holdemania massiliensis]|uniref:hypothetical protein n=1 Tax=Holdemania massiliensis TaxID=1468449 RepID=UPI001F065E98|nr:hypothetical protein [Holdemania massiliensis]MCH1940005.1 hypothetical protein [Holdemania massiliensis]
MEVKVTLEAGQSLIDLVNTLLQGLSRQTITSVPTEKKTKKQPKPEPASAPEPIAEPELETTEAPAEQWTTNEELVEIDYTKLRAVIRSLAAQKRAGGKDPNTLIRKYGGEKLSGVKDIDLPALKRDLEAL